MLLVVWNGFCMVMAATAWPRTSPLDRRLLALHFQPYLPFYAMLWLWSLNIRLFERMRIPYEKLFGSDDGKYLLKSEELHNLAAWCFSLWFTVVAAFLTISASEMRWMATWLPGVFAIVVMVTLLCPPPSPWHSSHAFFVRTLGHVISPIRPVSFADFLLADVLTSLARALADWERSLCAMTMETEENLFVMEAELEEHCPRGASLTNAILAAPYIIRMIQCIVVYSTSGEWTQLLNAGKYLTVVPVIVSSMLKHRAQETLSKNFWNRSWIVASVVNTVYSYCWDVQVDWDMDWCCGDHPGLMPSIKSDALYTPRGLYFSAMVSNFLIRIAWIYKLSVHLQHGAVIHGVVAMLEVYRRCQWICIRVESGLRKQAKPLALNEVHDRL